MSAATLFVSSDIPRFTAAIVAGEHSREIIIATLQIAAERNAGDVGTPLFLGIDGVAEGNAAWGIERRTGTEHDNLGVSHGVARVRICWDIANGWLLDQACRLPIRIQFRHDDRGRHRSFRPEQRREY